ncbi:ribosome biogenesis factor YjgA [Aquabacterium sp. OR-4]|uniref:ribosome biogenesis factor YjgA n=1 Tax=Aquabacterium sp. OR-4 TaxID=2978127 RepID=UPI0021B3AB80|nr:ribosome biogenesis factor YjgA [Aquabacterium sp. OR-4]MDT7836437.1 ribosome biogenesis factor YjgA [Aquabacterium sp. OR-4]
MRQRPTDALPEETAGLEGIAIETGRPSKTRLKQQAHDLQKLGVELSELPASRLAALDMPEGLRNALDELRRTRSHEGRRRQLQYVGKQMRFADEAPLREAVAAYKLGSAKDTLRLHNTERWRDEMVANDEAVTRWAQEFPGSDLQQLRSLVRAARTDAAAAPEKRNGRGYRALFQFIKPYLAAADGAANPEESSEDDDEHDD